VPEATIVYIEPDEVHDGAEWAAAGRRLRRTAEWGA
jgi:hypothetical protein